MKNIHWEYNFLSYKPLNVGQFPKLPNISFQLASQLFLILIIFSPNNAHNFAKILSNLTKFLTLKNMECTSKVLPQHSPYALNTYHLWHTFSYSLHDFPTVSQKFCTLTSSKYYFGFFWFWILISIPFQKCITLGGNYCDC